MAEQTDEWAIARRYVTAETLGNTRRREASPTDPGPAIEALAWLTGHLPVAQVQVHGP